VSGEVGAFWGELLLHVFLLAVVTGEPKGGNVEMIIRIFCIRIYIHT